MERARPNTAVAAHGAGTRRRTRLVLALACAGEFLVVLDASVVNVALPSIRTGLGFDAATLPWVVTSYTLVFAGFLLLGGRLSDLYGRKRVFVTGLALFSGASSVGGLAVTPMMLIAARGVQALGAAVLAPASLTLLTTTFTDGHRRVRALAIWTALASAGGAAGNILGGILTQYLSWRATLLINVPIGVIGLALAGRVLHNDVPTSGAHRAIGAAEAKRPSHRLDLPGAMSATLGVAAGTYALTMAHQRGWHSPGFRWALLVGLLGLGTFLVWEGRFSATPLIPLRLFAARAITVGNIAMLLAGAALMPMWYFLTLYMQHGLGLSPLLTGLGFLPHTVITVLIGAQLAPRIMTALPGRTLIVLGALLTAVGFWWQSQITPSDTYLSAVLGPAVVLSVGGGLLNTPLTTAVTSGVTDSDAGAASGLMNTTKQVGSGIGLAALATAVATTGTGDLSAPTSAPTAGYGTAFLTMAALMVVVAAIALALPTRYDTSA